MLKCFCYHLSRVIYNVKKTLNISYFEQFKLLKKTSTTIMSYTFNEKSNLIYSQYYPLILTKHLITRLLF